MKKYKAIGFDWSGVTFFYTANYSEIFQKLFGITSQKFYTVYHQYNHLLNSKNEDRRSVWKKILSHFKKEDEVDYFLGYLDGLPIGNFNNEMLQLIRNLKENGYKVGLLSNHTFEGAQQSRALGIENIFDVVLFSSEIGYMKPEKMAFDILAEKLNIDISELIYIDDTSKSLENAEIIGYTPILYSNMVELKKKLQELL